MNCSGSCSILMAVFQIGLHEDFKLNLFLCFRKYFRSSMVLTLIKHCKSLLAFSSPDWSNFCLYQTSNRSDDTRLSYLNDSGLLLIIQIFCVCNVFLIFIFFHFSFHCCLAVTLGSSMHVWTLFANHTICYPCCKQMFVGLWKKMVKFSL